MSSTVITPGGAVSINDDYIGFEAQHVTLVASTDTTITFTRAVRVVRVTNWDLTNRVLVKNGAISSDTDSTADRVGVSAATNLGSTEAYPLRTSTIHVRSAGASEVTVVGFF